MFAVRIANMDLCRSLTGPAHTFFVYGGKVQLKTVFTWIRWTELEKKKNDAPKDTAAPAGTENASVYVEPQCDSPIGPLTGRCTKEISPKNGVTTVVVLDTSTT